MHIRLATPEDIPRLVELERESNTAAHWTPRQYRDLLEGQRPVLVLAAVAEDGGMLGFLVARAVAGEWELENIVVSSSERRKGIARSLLQSLVDAARQAKADAIFLEVRESNRAARRLYQNVGFAQTGVRRLYYSGPGEDAVLYRLEVK